MDGRTALAMTEFASLATTEFAAIAINALLVIASEAWQSMSLHSAD